MNFENRRILKLQKKKKFKKTYLGAQATTLYYLGLSAHKWKVVTKMSLSMEH